MEGSIINAYKAVQHIFESEHGEKLSVTSRDKVRICLTNGNEISGRITDIGGNEVQLEILKGWSLKLPLNAVASIEQIEKSAKGRKADG